MSLRTMAPPPSYQELLHTRNEAHWRLTDYRAQAEAYVTNQNDCIEILQQELDETREALDAAVLRIGRLLARIDGLERNDKAE